MHIVQNNHPLILKRIRSYLFERKLSLTDTSFQVLMNFFIEDARLLPSSDVVAISQAPSPESNPNSPLPVNATVVHYTTVES